MCGLGLCMSKRGGKSCSAGTPARDAAPDAMPAVPVDPSDTTTHQIPLGAVVASLADAEPQSPKEMNTTDAEIHEEPGRARPAGRRPRGRARPLPLPIRPGRGRDDGSRHEGREGREGGEEGDE